MRPLSLRRRARGREKGGPCTSGAATSISADSRMGALDAGAWLSRGRGRAASGLHTHTFADGGWKIESRRKSQTDGRGIFCEKGTWIRQKEPDIFRPLVRRSLRLLSSREREDTSNGEMGTNPMGSNLFRQAVRRPGMRPQVPDKNQKSPEWMMIQRKMTQGSSSARMVKKSPGHGD